MSMNAELLNKAIAVCKPIQQKRIVPMRMVAIAPGHYFIDFSKAYFAGLELEIPNPEVGRVITVHMGETLSAPQTVHRQPGGFVRYHTTKITLQAGQTLYSVSLGKKDDYRMPAAVGAVMPFRYVELENAPVMVAAQVRQVAAYYPFDENAADFKCSDSKLNAIWELCKHTVTATTCTGMFVDGDRERRPYEADSYIHRLGWYCCTNDFALPRHTQEWLIHHQTWPTECILFSVLSSWEDYRQTGDLTSVRKFYDDLKAKTLLALARPDGLISTVEPPVSAATHLAIHFDVAESVYETGASQIADLVDWPMGERDGYEMKPVNTVVNAFHYRALELMANLACALQQSADEQLFRQASAKVLRALNTKLVHPSTGLYVDGEGSQHSSLHANLFPLAFGMVPAERRAKVVEYVRSRGMACSVYGAQFLMEALFNNGLAEQALALMTANNDRSWTHMLELGATLTLEAWDAKYKPNWDWNHPWATAPANILPRKVIGVEPLEPGFSRILIQPRPGNLTWAEGKVPTIRGPVVVKYAVTPGKFRLTFEIPATSTAKVGIPAGLGGTVSLDGKTVSTTTTDGYVFVDSVGAGKHELILQ